MKQPNDPADQPLTLGHKIAPQTQPAPEWTPSGPNIETNAAGQVRTNIPENEVASFPALYYREIWAALDVYRPELSALAVWRATAHKWE